MQALDRVCADEKCEMVFHRCITHICSNILKPIISKAHLQFQGRLSLVARF